MMLDYGTVQIVNPNMGLSPSSIIMIAGAIAFGVILAVFISVNNNSVEGGVAVGLIFSIACFAFFKHKGDINNLVLVKIEAKNIEISSNVYPSASKYPYFQKEGDKVYYYDTISAQDIGDPYKIKKDTEENFEKISFNLENSEKQEEK